MFLKHIYYTLLFLFIALFNLPLNSGILINQLQEIEDIDQVQEIEDSFLLL